MVRPAHLLRPNKATTRPTRIILFDVETVATPVSPRSVEHTLRLGVACFWLRSGRTDSDRVKWCDFTTSEEFWEFVTAHVYPRTRLVLSSHNLSFDLPILKTFSLLPLQGYKLTGYYCKGLTTLCRFKSPRGNLDFVDNSNFFPGKLADLGELVGLKKLEVDFDVVGDEELARYCRRDVEILLALWRQWFDFLDEHDLGRWHRTLPSQAFGGYRHRFLRHKVLIHNHEKALLLERSAYHGGRVECLRVGAFNEGPYYKLDVNSMYPYVMHEYNYPLSLYHYEEKPTLSYLANKLKRYHVIAHVRITTEIPAFPVIVAGHLSYPVGEFDTVLTTEELKLILQVGSVDRVYRLAYYRAAPIFRDYVDYFYPLKVRYDEEDNLTFRTICKGFLNFLYGKFGQRGISDKVLGSCDSKRVEVIDVVDLETHERYEILYIGGTIIRRRHTDEAYNSFPAVAAEVTANARLYLHALVNHAGRCNTFYMDTDSLIVNGEGYARLSGMVHSTALGALKREGVADYLEIRAPKDYTFGSSVRIKGVRSSASEVAPGVYVQEKFPSVQGLLRQGSMAHYRVEEATKVLSRQITSGVTDGEGFVRPFVLPLPSLVPPEGVPPLP